MGYSENLGKSRENAKKVILPTSFSPRRNYCMHLKDQSENGMILLIWM